MKRWIYVAAVLPLLVASCDKEKLIDTTDNTPVPLSIDATIGTIGISSEITPRSLVSGSSFGDGSDIGIFVTGNGYTPVVTIYTYGGSAWSLKTTPAQSPIYLTKNEATVYGFYPATAADANTTTNKTIPITIASSYEGFTVPESQADYLYATDGNSATTMEKVSKASPEASLTFYHALSQLSFIVNKAENFGGTGSLTSLKVEAVSDNITGSGTLNLDGTGITLNETVSKSITLTGSATINSPSGTDVTATALVAPLASQSVELTMIIDEQSYTGNISGAVWEAGKKYSYTVTVGGGELIIESVTIKDWENGGSGNVIVN
ncbi:MAG TPA: fimbrillin family protein [Dysgonamonadaceae bacterium]|nr:fimbrillin family protein [Dysgonamonadaceae bacterium]